MGSARGSAGHRTVREPTTEGRVDDVSRFLPVDVTANGNLVLRRLPQPPLREPFLPASYAKAAGDTPDRVFTTSELATRQPAALEPAVLMAHCGRCGSTLLCRLLDATGVAATFREPDAVVDALKSRSRVTARPLLAAALAQFAWSASAVGRIAVVKVASDSGPAIDALTAAAHPRIFVVRDAAEVVPRVLDTPPDWLARASADGNRGRLDVACDVWNRAVGLSLDRTLAGDGLLVDYRQLVAEPVVTVGRVLRWLGIAVRVDAETIADLMGRHAKSGVALGSSGSPADPPPLGEQDARRLRARTSVVQLRLESWRANAAD